MRDRRNSSRRNVDLLFNQYVDGSPWLCRSVDLSAGGVRAHRTGSHAAPKLISDGVMLELGLPDGETPLWIWARPIATRDDCQILRFVGLNRVAEERLERFVGEA